MTKYRQIRKNTLEVKRKIMPLGVALTLDGREVTPRIEVLFVFRVVSGKPDIYSMKAAVFAVEGEVEYDGAALYPWASEFMGRWEGDPIGRIRLPRSKGGPGEIRIADRTLLHDGPLALS